MGGLDPESAARDLSMAIQLDPEEKDPAANRARQMIVAFTAFFEECSEAVWTLLKSMNNSNVMISIVDGGSSDEIHVADLSC